MKTHLSVAMLLLSSLTAPACKSRSVWFWQETGSPYGAAAIVGNNVLENQAISFLNARSVKRVYGSYGTQPVTHPGVSAGWNAKLQTAGIQSQFLMSENTWIFPTNHASLLTKISQRVLDFNNAPGRTAPERFDALHLDIEPHALSEWSSLTPTGRRDFLLLLRDTYAAVRQHLTIAGAPGFPVYADLPVWFDRLPTEGGSVGWSSAAERNLWYANIATNLTGISLMAFDQTSFSAISNSVSWELANIAGAVVRVGLEADIGTGQTWATLADFDAMLETVEAAFGAGHAVDIQSYTLWREAIAALPILPVAAVLEVTVPLVGGGISFDTETNFTYLIHHSADLCAWQEILRLKSQQPGPVTWPVRFAESQGFWRITRFRTPQP